jgi:hypothetical protein
MKMAILAALAAAGAASLLVSANAQNALTITPHPNARDSLGAQLDQLSARIDRRLARGQISQHDADTTHREINDLQAQASEDRLQNGGRLKEADRFALQGQITQLKEEIDRDRTIGASPPPH